MDIVVIQEFPATPLTLVIVEVAYRDIAATVEFRVIVDSLDEAVTADLVAYRVIPRIVVTVAILVFQLTQVTVDILEGWKD